MFKFLDHYWVDLPKSSSNTPLSSKNEELDPNMFMEFKSGGGPQESYRLQVTSDRTSVKVNDMKQDNLLSFICSFKI